MNTKEVQKFESYFKTENEHWNGYPKHSKTLNQCGV